MSAENGDVREVAEQVIDFAERDFDIGTGADAATILGLSISADEDEINSRYRDLAVLLHPDSSPFEDVEQEVKVRAFSLISNARDSLIEVSGEGLSEEEAAKARATGAPDSPGTGGWGPFAQERQDLYKETFEQVKLFYAEEFLGRSVNSESFEQAVNTGKISQEDLDRIERVLREQFGVPELTLDDIGRVVASLLVSGSIRLGNLSRMAGVSHRFERGGDDSIFTNRRNDIFSNKRRDIFK